MVGPSTNAKRITSFMFNDLLISQFSLYHYHVSLEGGFFFTFNGISLKLYHKGPLGISTMVELNH